MFDQEIQIVSELKAGKEGTVEWTSPSNIALIKYWGKKEHQIPRNPSLSFSLEKSRTVTQLKYNLKEKPDFSWRFQFEGVENKGFETKLKMFFGSILEHLPYLSYTHLEIKSHNTFPHSTGIASSASAMSALALCLLDIGYQLAGKTTHTVEFFRKASYIARLGSGSAARSVFPGFALWGSSEEIPGSDDHFALGIPLKKDSFFHGLRDAVLIVSSGTKKVSSSQGHDLMKTNPYATLRYQHARENLERLLSALNREDKEEFIRIVENEALTLHGLMMSSDPGFILMKNGSIEIIGKIQDFRKSTGIFMAFTLDAGPNVHLIYHEKDQEIISEFINTELITFLENQTIIWDRLGQGPLKTL